MKWWNYRLGRVAALIACRYGLSIQDGPFVGMRYVPRTLSLLSRGVVCKSALVPKLLGSYEAELHEMVEELVQTGYETVVNIGCGEGYYAIGFALRLPGARIFAFDTDAQARDLCAEMARENGVGARVVVSGKCDWQTLAARLTARSLVFCDCEGCELDLLHPDFVPGLKACDLVVELHDFIDPRISETIHARFRISHSVRFIKSIDRDPLAYPALSGLTIAEQRLAVNEFRPPMAWAFMKSKGIQG